MTRRRAGAALGALLIAALGAGCTGSGPEATGGPTTGATSVSTSASTSTATSVATSGSTSVPTSQPTPGPSGLMGSPELLGLSEGPAPWPAETRYLPERLQAMGMPPLGRERLRVHFHDNLVVTVHGQRVPIPAGIGIRGNRLAEIHTHAGAGTIHIEAAQPRDFTLGMVFDVWGVRFTDDCIGGYCADGTNQVRVFLDGQPYDGPVRDLPLTDEQVVVVTYGTEDELLDPMPARFVYEGKPKPA